jgi:hypothetical protein
LLEERNGLTTKMMQSWCSLQTSTEQSGRPGFFCVRGRACNCQLVQTPCVCIVLKIASKWGGHEKQLAFISAIALGFFSWYEQRNVWWRGSVLLYFIVTTPASPRGIHHLTHQSRFIDCNQVNNYVKQFGSVQVRGAVLGTPQNWEFSGCFFLKISSIVGRRLL